MIELLVVMIIIGIMLATVRPMLSNSSTKTRDWQCESNMKQISMALQAYVEDYEAFPRSLQQIYGIIVGNRDLAACSRTGRPYHYRAPGANAGPNTVLMRCAAPGRSSSAWPHRDGKCRFELTAGGEVRRVERP